MTRIPMIIVGLLIPTVIAPAVQARAETLTDAEVRSLFDQANEAFHEANDLVVDDPVRARELYHKAAMRFERIVRDGDIRNGKLYYNIGNAYFRMGDVGRAILNYRRAEQFIPHDLNLRQNLSYARTKRVDRIPEQQRKRILKTLFFWHYDLASRTRAVIFTMFFVPLWIAAAVKLFVRKAPLGWIIVVCAAVSAMMLGSLTVQALRDARHVEGVVVEPEVTARKGDGMTYQPSFQEPLHAGTEFVLREDRGDWYHVELPDGRQCWIPAKSAGLVR